MFNTLFTTEDQHQQRLSTEQYLSNWTKQKVDSILTDPNTLKLMRRATALLEGTTGGSSQVVYGNLREQSGIHYAGNVLYGLNNKIIDSRKRARKMEFKHNITVKYLLDLWIEQQGRCAVTGVVMNFESGDSYNKNAYCCSVDRIVNENGYTVGNVRLLTHWANNAKSTWDDYLLETMITEIINNKYSTQ